MSDNQRRLMEAIDTHNLVLALALPTGKILPRIARAVRRWSVGAGSPIVLSRLVTVEAGESLGLPAGDLEDKLAPYLRPLYERWPTGLGRQALEGAESPTA